MKNCKFDNFLRIKINELPLPSSYYVIRKFMLPINKYTSDVFDPHVDKIFIDKVLFNIKLIPLLIKISIVNFTDICVHTKEIHSNRKFDMRTFFIKTEKSLSHIQVFSDIKYKKIKCGYVTIHTIPHQYEDFDLNNDVCTSITISEHNLHNINNTLKICKKDDK